MLFVILVEFLILGRFYMYLMCIFIFYILLLFMVVKKFLIIFLVNNVWIIFGFIGFLNLCYNLMFFSRYRVEWYEFIKKCVLFIVGNILLIIDLKFVC